LGLDATGIVTIQKVNSGDAVLITTNERRPVL
jgi:hypothetical protein